MYMHIYKNIYTEHLYVLKTLPIAWAVSVKNKGNVPALDGLTD
jgi:hypothetical protein